MPWTSSSTSDGLVALPSTVSAGAATLVLGFELLRLIAQRLELRIGGIGGEIVERVGLDVLRFGLVQRVLILLPHAASAREAVPTTTKPSFSLTYPQNGASCRKRIATRAMAHANLSGGSANPYLGPCRGNPAMSVDCHVE